MKRVLVAIAETDGDEPAIEETLGLLKADHQYLFLTVNKPHEDVAPLTRSAPPVLAPVLIPDPNIYETVDQQAHAGAQSHLESIIGRLQITAQIRVERGDPALKICAVASEQNVDLIVIGSSDPNLVQRILRDSISDQVVHSAPCPVLLIPSKRTAGARAN